MGRTKTIGKPKEIEKIWLGTEEAKAYLTRYSFDFIYATLRCWEEMEAQLWHQFGRGF